MNWSGTQDAAFGNTSFGDVAARQSNGVYSNNVLGLNNANPALGKLTWQPLTSGGPVAVGATPVGDNVWHFIAVTFDGVTGQQKLYLDGNLDGSGVITGALNANNTMPFTIGAWIGDGHGYSSSSIHDVRIFDTVLSQSDLQALQSQDTVPEPATRVLLGVAACGLHGCRRHPRGQ